MSCLCIGPLPEAEQFRRVSDLLSRLERAGGKKKAAGRAPTAPHKPSVEDSRHGRSCFGVTPRSRLKCRVRWL